MVNARKGWFYQALFYRATLKSIKYSRCTNYRPDKDQLAKEKDSLRENLTCEKLGLDSRLYMDMQFPYMEVRHFSLPYTGLAWLYMEVRHQNILQQSGNESE